MSRRENDFYPTPRWVAEALLCEISDRVEHVFDPACGAGDLLLPFKGAGLGVEGYELDKTLACEAQGALDVPIFCVDSASSTLRSWRAAHKNTAIVMNPPFSLAGRFLQLAVDSLDGDGFIEVHALLRLNFLAGQTRHRWWKENKPSGITVLSRRPSFTGDGKTDGTDYAWFSWRPWSAATSLRWAI